MARRGPRLISVSAAVLCGWAVSAAVLTAHLDDQQMPHIWHVDVGGAHDFPVWKNDLYRPSTLLCR